MACSVYWDNGPTGNNEVYAACVDSGATGSAYCFGDGSGATACPCGNEAANPGGCSNSTGHGGELDGSGVPSVSESSVVLSAVEPVYEEMNGWRESTFGLCSMEELPGNARAYVSRLEELIGTPVEIISTGPDREETICLKHPFD